MDMSLSKLGEIVKDRGTWRAAVYGGAKSWTWLSDWTTREGVKSEVMGAFQEGGSSSGLCLRLGRAEGQRQGFRESFSDQGKWKLWVWPRSPGAHGQWAEEPDGSLGTANTWGAAEGGSQQRFQQAVAWGDHSWARGEGRVSRSKQHRAVKGAQGSGPGFHN